MLDPDLLALLNTLDTPTVCNAIEIAQGRRGFDGFTKGTMAAAGSGPLVGFARTARISGAAPSREPVEDIRARRMSYYRYMATGNEPTIAVIEDMDFPNAIGAYWGEVNAAVHLGFGMAGALTNGVVRDLDDLPPEFPIIAGSVGPSHGFVHVRDIDCAVNVFGMVVHPGDLIHADQHGAVVVPPDVIADLSGAVQKLAEIEAIVLDAARKPGFDFEAFEKAWAAFEAARV